MHDGLSFTRPFSVTPARRPGHAAIALSPAHATALLAFLNSL